MKGVLVIFIALLCHQLTAQEPANLVNPFIGTSNYGATHPGAVRPHGMVSVVPFNVTPHPGNEYSNTNNWCSNPYVYNNKWMTGFSHVNLSGVGCPDLGSIVVMPTCGELIVDVNKYGSKLSEQKAEPGYYSTHLERYKIDAEVTATNRSGLSRFTFPAGKANILIDLGHGLTNESGAHIKRVANNEIEGYKLMGTFCYRPDAVIPVYFVLRIKRDNMKSAYWKFHQQLPGARHNWSSSSNSYKLYTKYNKELSGEKIGACFSFDAEEGEQVEVQVGVSYVSIENARENLEKEQTNLSFEQIKKQAFEAWNKELMVVEVEGGTENDRIQFYTALYHLLLHPNILQDVNGDYPAMESDAILNSQKENRYTVFSLWDTYRTVHPLMSLLYPQKQLTMVRNMVDMYKESGWLPKWEIYGREADVMEGDPALIVINDTYRRGLTDFDVNAAYLAMLKHANTSADNFIRHDNEFYLENHYIPFTKEFDNSVSQALELYISDYNLALMANEMGDKTTHRKSLQRSMGYKKYFDKDYKLLRPVTEEGKYMEGFDPLQGENFQAANGFHEGSSWQYSFAVPHDTKGLIRLMGGKNKFVQQLNKCFKDSLFDMSNEPDMGYPYLFNYASGEEWRTQKQVHDCIKRYFKNEPGGLPGNDDTGTLSAWLIYSMMGLYPSCPGDMNYTLSSPLFDKITIHLDTSIYENKQIVIESQRKSPDDIFIKEIQINGHPYDRFFINHHDLIKTGHIKYKLGSNPKHQP
ncbi:GH92 family glycosyl hydrolase [Carboxylicivirga sp. M1479]|uniref:GH92 family glycosyl hydrolase n=1 Tax=Carboxylicivirga sp. M1479 TaxID=2594476 RepID=UPI001177B071|nr:GH92 family glycosyl hydrolase [Carboxylicivirga sp. M1479]TRX66243.1 glycoside hydrolase family 92 protein [Carboxylicivirga sp. M1479]